MAESVNPASFTAPPRATLVGELPMPTGVRSGVDVDPLPPPLHPTSFLSRATLTQISVDYRLFSLAPFFPLGRMTSDPVNDWENETGKRGVSGAILLENAVLDVGGLAPGQQLLFNRMSCYCLRFVQAQLWPELFSFLGRVGGHNEADGFLWRTMAQVLDVPDFRAAATAAGLAAAKIPTVPVTLFGLDSTEGLYFWEPEFRPRLVRADPDPTTLQLAAAMFSGSTDPFAAANN